jgi:hypothetical protein
MSVRNICMAVLVSTAACTGDNVDGTIDYSLSGGLAGGITTALHIERGGRYTVTSLDHAPVHGRLGASELASLRAQIEAANFPALDEVYACCPDDLVETISVESAGESHTVRAERSADKPARLDAVLETFQELAGTRLPRP